ncbi:MAG: enoyl-CoA hydratase/isomerase family protein [Acidobacteriota bacterium]
MSETGSVDAQIADGVAEVSFFHPQKNSLPGGLLRRLAAEIDGLGRNDEVRVVALRSLGDGPFCAGASFDEMLAAQDFEQARTFFMGFAQVILAMKKCPKFVVTRVQGKAVGGGVGLIAASDYVLASQRASIKLAEFALGFGPFVIGPAVERKIGQGAFAAASIDTEWRDANWCTANGLYTEIYESSEELDGAFARLTSRLAKTSQEATTELKGIFWAGTDGWETLLPSRAEISARLILSDFTRNAISAFREKR